MTTKEILQEFKIKYIDNAHTYRDGAKNITDFLVNYFKTMQHIYKSYEPFFKRLYSYDIRIILTPGGFWYYEHNIFYNDISKALDKKIKSILKSFNYKYLYDIKMEV